MTLVLGGRVFGVLHVGGALVHMEHHWGLEV